MNGSAPGVFAEVEAADGLFIVDRDQRIVFWGSSAEKILGLSASSAVGRRCFEVIAGREGPSGRYCRRNCPVISNARKGRASPGYDLGCVTAGGEAKWLNFTILVPTTGELRSHAIHLFRDVTRRRKLEEFARGTTRALRRLETEAGNGAAADLDPAPIPSLSRREGQVLRLLAAGCGTGEIATALGVRPVTARNHISRLLNKLGTQNRLQAVVYASRRGLI